MEDKISNQDEATKAKDIIGKLALACEENPDATIEASR